MRRALVLAYYFPPIGGAGVQNTSKLVRWLPSLGYEPIVVTGPGARSGRWTPHDDSLEQEVAETAVVRVEESEPAPSGSGRGRLERWLRVSSSWDRWWVEESVRAGSRVKGVDVVYVSMSPFSGARAAATLAKTLGVPWVASLRDPWALDEMMVYPTRLHRSLELNRMRRELASAQAIVMNTDEARRALLSAFPELRAKLVRTITNGYDRDDFEAPLELLDEHRFRVTHTGYLHTAAGAGRSSPLRRALGGAVDGVDVSTRSHLYLLGAVNRLLERRPDLADRLDVSFAGVMTERDEAIISSCPVARGLGYLSHGESTALLRRSNLLFLPMQKLPDGTRATIVPGKTYEYLASGVPILAAVPPGDARDLLVSAGNALICEPDDVEAMEHALEGAIDRWRAGVEPPAPPAELLARLERRRLAQEVAQVLDAVVDDGSTE